MGENPTPAALCAEGQSPVCWALRRMCMAVQAGDGSGRGRTLPYWVLGITPWNFFAFPSNNLRWRQYVFGHAVRPSIRFFVRSLSIETYFARCDISLLNGRISMKFGKNIRHVSGHCWKDFLGQRSKVKVVTIDRML